jgi:hypothetical protein
MCCKIDKSNRKKLEIKMNVIKKDLPYTALSYS